MEHDRQAERLEQEADKLEQHGEKVAERIEGAREEWESKTSAQDVPGAQSHEALHPEEAEGDEQEETQEEAPGVRDADDSAEVGDES
jgi:hypothetical protein